MNNLLRWLAPAMALCLPLATLAQPATLDPGKPDTTAPRLRYRSACADYKLWQDIKPGDGKAMNDAVGKSGGRFLGMPLGAASAPAPTASNPAMTDHSGHQVPMQGGKK